MIQINYRSLPATPSTISPIKSDEQPSANSSSGRVTCQGNTRKESFSLRDRLAAQSSVNPKMQNELKWRVCLLQSYSFFTFFFAVVYRRANESMKKEHFSDVGVEFSSARMRLIWVESFFNW